ncbi:MAG: hypothetical protein SGILL_006291 [Bacillariaceae sp.]
MKVLYGQTIALHFRVPKGQLRHLKTVPEHRLLEEMPDILPLFSIWIDVGKEPGLKKRMEILKSYERIGGTGLFPVPDVLNDRLDCVLEKYLQI